MKKYQGHIYYLGAIAMVICVAGIIALSSFSTDFNGADKTKKAELSLDEDSPESVLDTLAMMEDPCYEYRSLERNCDGDTSKDVIVKTVVKVEQPDGHYKELNEGSVKSLLPNTSINLMIEKYKIERRREKEITSFFVTVESFNTVLEKNSNNEFITPILHNESTSLTEEQWEMLNSHEAEKLLVKTCNDKKIPM